MAARLWQIDGVHSSIQFSVRHLVVSKVIGQFRRWSAELAIDEADLSRSSVSVSIDVASVDTGHAQRDADLLSPRFFDAEKHPQITFRSRRIEPAGAAFRMIGDLTVRDVTREVTLEAELGGFVADPWGGRRAGFSGKASVLRHDFGMTWNMVLDAGGVFVGERVDIAIEIEAVAEAERSAA